MESKLGFLGIFCVLSSFFVHGVGVMAGLSHSHFIQFMVVLFAAIGMGGFFCQGIRFVLMKGFDVKLVK